MEMSMANDLAWLMQALLNPAIEPRAQVDWSPAVDVYRTRQGWLVKFDLAGVSPGDVQLSASGRRLTLRGRRRDWCIEEAQCCSAYSMEITYSQFHRTIELPCDVDSLQIGMDYRDGMLLVRLSERGS